MKCFDFQNDLFIPVVGFNFPTSEIEGNKLLPRVFSLVCEIGEQDGDGSIGTDESENPQLNGFEIFSLLFRYLVDVPTARVNANLVFVLSGLDESMYGRKRGLSRASEYKKALESSDEIKDQLVARVASVEEQDALARDEFKKVFDLITFGRIHRDNGTSDGQPSKDIVCGGDQTLRIVPFSRVLEATIRIKLVSHLFCGREVVFGPVYSEDGHTVPGEFRVLGAALVGESYRIIEDALENLPVDLVAGSGESTVVDGFGFGPEAASPGCSEEFTRFHVHPLGFAV